MILHLILHRQWFDVIAAGTKKIEYREIKPYWEKRLDNKTYSEVQFKNGYQKAAPVMRVECLGISRNCDFFEIHLGEILEIKNYLNRSE